LLLFARERFDRSLTVPFLWKQTFDRHPYSEMIAVTLTLVLGQFFAVNTV